jgi:hypothetical protein
MHTYYSMQFNISEVQRIGYLNNSYVIDQMVPLILEMVVARVSSCGVGGAIYGLVFRLKYIRCCVHCFRHDSQEKIDLI